MARRSPRPPLAPETLSSDAQHLFTLLNEGTDVSVVVVAVSFIDACLASLLGKRLRKGSSTVIQMLDPTSGPIGSFSARANLAYALTLIDKPIHHDLGVLAELRNVTAHHHFELTFSSPDVIKHCERLTFLDSLSDPKFEGSLFGAAVVSHPRNRFSMTAVMITNHLLLAALGTKHLGEADRT
jgi:DNA-binding MltR family transcriptional regulator